MELLFGDTARVIRQKCLLFVCPCDFICCRCLNERKICGNLTNNGRALCVFRRARAFGLSSDSPQRCVQLQESKREIKEILEILTQIPAGRLPTHPCSLLIRGPLQIFCHSNMAARQSFIVLHHLSMLTRMKGSFW